VNRTLTSLAVVVTLVLAALLFIEHPAIDSDLAQNPTRDTPISIIEHSSTREFDANGQLQYLLKVDRALQYLRFADDQPLSIKQGFTELHNPQLTIYDAKSDDRWHFESRYGRTENNGEQIILWGQVVAHKPGENGRDYRVTTERLEILPEAKLATTEEAVNIRSPNGVADAVGMHIDMNSGLTELKSQVRGTYDIEL